jgi:hypothetical protein
VFDDQELARPLGGTQIQTQLILECGHDRDRFPVEDDEP